MSEGRLRVPGGEVAYRVVGPAGADAVLVLHGGPGAGMVSTTPVAGLADAWRVVMYDQMGCGASDRPDTPDALTVERFVREVQAVRDGLGLERIHLVGHSWGAMLALDYALTQPAGLRSLVLSNGTASVPQFREEIRRLVGEMHPEIREPLEADDRDSPAYAQAMMAFYVTHLIRVEPPPEALQTLECIAASTTYVPMWGADELHVDGVLRDWERRDRLGEIRVPTLVLCGEYDECTPVLARTLHQGIGGSELHVFPNASHFTFFEQPQAWLDTVRDFLRKCG